MRKLLVKPSFAGLKPYVIGWGVQTPWALVIGGDFLYPYCQYNAEIFISSTESNTEKALYRIRRADIFSPAWINLTTTALNFKILRRGRNKEKSLENIISTIKVIGLGKFNIHQNQGVVVLASEINKRKVYVDYAVIFEKLVTIPISLQNFIVSVIGTNTENVISCFIHEIKETASIYWAEDEEKVNYLVEKEITNYKVEVGYFPIFNEDPMGEEMLPFGAVYKVLHPSLYRRTTNLDVFRLKRELELQKEKAWKITLNSGGNNDENKQNQDN